MKKFISSIIALFTLFVLHGQDQDSLSGNFTEEEARELAGLLQEDSLEVDFSNAEENAVGTAGMWGTPDTSEIDKIKVFDFYPESVDMETVSYFNFTGKSDALKTKNKTIVLDFPTGILYEVVRKHVDSTHVIIGSNTHSIIGRGLIGIEGLQDKSYTISVHRFRGKDTLAITGLENNTRLVSMNPQATEEPMFIEDTIVFGILAVVLALIFYTASKRSWQKFYTYVPALLLCYLIPAILATTGVISEEYSNLYPMAKNYLLPGALILMTLGIDFKGIINLGPKALIMFVTATVGIIIGGPLAMMIFGAIDPAVVGGEELDAAWRGFATLAGSWIGGGANQAAMLETYQYNQELYGKMVTVDIVVANLWMAFLLWGAARAHKFDKWLKADSSAIEKLKDRVADYQSSISKKPTLPDYMVILGLTFGVVSIAHFLGIELAEICVQSLGEGSPFSSSFFWLVVLSTTGGLIMSATKLRKYEGAGASKIGGVFIYILVATIGMKMDIMKALEEPALILVGIVWMLIHVGLLFFVAKLIRAPFFFVAVGSKANVGGAASAPIVASAFHPSLASVGAILAVLGYALGTYGAIACAEMMRALAP